MNTSLFSFIAQTIDRSRDRALVAVNTELVNLYWIVGGFVSHQLERSSWGNKTVQDLSDFLNEQQPGLKGFDRKNIYRMVQFFDCWKESALMSEVVENQDSEIVATVWRQLEELKENTLSSEVIATVWQQLDDRHIRHSPLVKVNWSIHKILMARCKLIEEREFYLRNCIADRYSVRELDRQISSSLFERVVLNKKQTQNFPRKVAATLGDSFKNSYVFEFLNLPEVHSERDLQKALVQQMKSFILELGKDFLFIGDEYRLQVGNSDYYLDLLFFHRTLQCMVVIELKADKFKPGDIGQLNFYLEALDRDVKKKHEKPSIGILLCKDKDEEVVKYALNRNLSPAMVAEYQTNLPDRKMLQKKLQQWFESTSDGDD